MVRVGKRVSGYYKPKMDKLGGYMEKEIAKMATVLAITVNMQKKIIRWLTIALIISCVATCATSICLIRVLSNTQPSIKTSCQTTTVKSRISKANSVETTKKKVVIEG